MMLAISFVELRKSL